VEMGRVYLYLTYTSRWLELKNHEGLGRSTSPRLSVIMTLVWRHEASGASGESLQMGKHETTEGMIHYLANSFGMIKADELPSLGWRGKVDCQSICTCLRIQMENALGLHQHMDLRRGLTGYQQRQTNCSHNSTRLKVLWSIIAEPWVTNTTTTGNGLDSNQGLGLYEDFSLASPGAKMPRWWHRS